MKKLARPGFVILFILLVAAAAVPAFADHPEGATAADLRELRTEVNRLDDTLQMLDDAPRARAGSASASRRSATAWSSCATRCATTSRTRTRASERRRPRWPTCAATSAA